MPSIAATVIMPFGDHAIGDRITDVDLIATHPEKVVRVAVDEPVEVVEEPHADAPQNVPHPTTEEG